jgi:hypothetical protein
MKVATDEQEAWEKVLDELRSPSYRRSRKVISAKKVIGQARV